MTIIKRIVVFLTVFFFLSANLCFAKNKLAVMTLKPLQVADDLAAALSAEVRTAIQAQGEYEVISNADLADLIERTKIEQALSRCDESQCLIDFGRQIGTKYMVAGTVSKVGDIYSIDIRLIDTEGENAGVRKRVSRKISKDESLLFPLATKVSALLMSDSLDSSTAGIDGQLLTAEDLIEPKSSGWWKWALAGLVVIGVGVAAGSGGGGDDSAGAAPEETPTGSMDVTW